MAGSSADKNNAGEESLAGSTRDTDPALVAIIRVGAEQRTCAEYTEHAATHNHLWVGTDCSGIEARIQAFRALDLPFSHTFSSDTDNEVRKLINAHFNPLNIYEDAAGTPKRQQEQVTSYVVGFPCQPFSSAGKQCGFQDERGCVIDHIILLLRKHSPAA